MALEISLLGFLTVILAAVIDGLNPCSFGVVLLLLSTLIAKRQSKSLLAIGVRYALGVGVTTLVMMGIVAGIVTLLPNAILPFLIIILGCAAVTFGLFEIKDYFWYGAGLTLAIPDSIVRNLQQRIKNISEENAFFLGAVAALASIPCTGGLALLTTALIAIDANTTTMSSMLLFYSFIVSSLALTIVLLVRNGIKLHTIQHWKQSNKRYLRLTLGLVLIVIGWLLLLTAHGNISLT